jgi:hypothetical protein
MIVYPTVGGVERRAVNILVDSEAKRQIHLQPEPTTAWIDLYRPKKSASDERYKGRCRRKPFARRLPVRADPRWQRGRRIHSPSGRVHEKRPDNIDRRIDDVRWAARIGHRTPSPVKDIWRSA